MSRGGKVTKFPGAKERPEWEVRLVRNRDGDVKPTTHNLILILENDQELTGLLRLDEFANRVVMARTPPWGGSSTDEFSEIDGVELAAWLGQPERYSMSVKTSQVLEAVEAVARRHRFHPVRDYLLGLRWDGKERIPSFFSDFQGAVQDDYTAQVALNFMISAAARILNPGCKVDTMLILEGAQGIGKTRVVRKLFGGDRWYMDAQRSPVEKDFYQDLQGKWGVEIGEMTVFSKAESNKVKQTLSAQADTYRPSYGRYSRTFPRQCIFIGTTNEDQYLRDPTGARRFLPVRVSAVDVDGVAAVRDQLWAEAVQRYQNGEPWWLLPESAQDHQDARYMEDSWGQPIADWLEGRCGDGHYKGVPLECRGRDGEILRATTTNILALALSVDLARHDRQAQMRVGAIMQRMGWARKRPNVDGRRVWFYVRPEVDDG